MKVGERGTEGERENLKQNLKRENLSSMLCVDPDTGPNLTTPGS